MTAPKAPSRLSSRARAFWNVTVDKYELGEHELLVLEQVCRAMDDIRTLENGVRKALHTDGDGLMVRGSQNQRVVNPLIPELRQARQGLQRLIAALKLPEDIEVPDAEDAATARSRSARSAAQARWSTSGSGS
jgi:phage terminase small subunit